MGKQAHTREEACSLQPAESRLVSEGDKYRDWKGAQDNIGVKKKTDKKLCLHVGNPERVYKKDCTRKQHEEHGSSF